MVLLFKLLAKLPLRGLHWLGRAVGWLVYGLSPRYRQRLRDNLAQAGLNTVALRHAAIAAIGQGMLELPYLWMRPEGTVLQHVTVEHWDVVERALAGGRGVLMLSPHLGGFELVGQYCAAQLHSFTALYRPHRKAALAPLVEQARGKHLDLASADLKGVRKLLKALRAGRAIGILPDQVPTHGDGVWADFFGKPAYTMTLPARLAQATNAAIVLVYCERLPQARYRMVFKAYDAPLAEDLVEATTQLNHAMEEIIRGCPQQYLWSYNRYKSPARMTPTVSADESSAP